MKNLFVMLGMLLVVVMVFSGCATPYDVDIEAENTKRVESHNTGQSAQVTARSTAVQDIATSYKCSDPDSKDCGAILAMMNYRGMEALERIQGTQYQGPVGKTGVAVQEKVAENGVPIVSVISNGAVSTAAIKNAKQDIRVSEGSTYENNESHTTTIGDSNTVASTHTKAPAAEEEEEEEEEGAEEEGSSSSE